MAVRLARGVWRFSSPHSRPRRASAKQPAPGSACAMTGATCRRMEVRKCGREGTCEPRVVCERVRFLREVSACNRRQTVQVAYTRDVEQTLTCYAHGSCYGGDCDCEPTAPQTASSRLHRWTATEAAVVCKMLGFGWVGAAALRGLTAPAEVPIGLDGVDCECGCCGVLAGMPGPGRMQPG